MKTTRQLGWRRHTNDIDPKLFSLLGHPDNLLLSTFLSPEMHRPIPDIPEMDIPEIEN